MSITREVGFLPLIIGPDPRQIGDSVTEVQVNEISPYTSGFVKVVNPFLEGIPGGPLYGGANGFATLDNTGKVPSSQLPSIAVTSGAASPVKAATTVPGTLATSFIAGNTIDGYTLVLGDRILIKNQASGVENGIYEVTAGLPVRTDDYDTGFQVSGIMIMVQNGTVNKDIGYICNNGTGSDIVGTSSLTYAPYTASLTPANLQFKNSVRVATFANGTFATDFAAGQVVDDITLVLNDRILLKNQSININNGIYIVTAGSPSRADDMPAGNAAACSYVFVQEGDRNADTSWLCTNDSGSDIVGTDGLNFTLATPKVIIASNNYSLSINSFRAITTGTNITIFGANTFGALTSGGSNSGFGYNLFPLATTGSGNTSIGSNNALNATSASNNVAIGDDIFPSLTTGSSNIAIGNETLSSVSTASSNTAVGNLAGRNLSGSFNTAFGARAALGAAGGSNLVAVGYQALTAVTGSDSVAVGAQALLTMTSATGNTAVGYQSLRLTTGNNSTATGYQSLTTASVGINNAYGYQSMTATTTGTNNCAFGTSSLAANTIGNFNTVTGNSASSISTNASNNAIYGYNSAQLLTSGSSNTSHGYISFPVLTSGASNVAIGDNSGGTLTTGSFNTMLGSTTSVSSASSTERISIGYNASSTIDYSCQIGQNVLQAGAKLNFRTQNIADAAWVGGGVTGANIDNNGNIIRGGAASSVNYLKEPVDAATDVRLGLNASIASGLAYNNVGGPSLTGQIGATLAVAGVFTVDGIALVTGDRLLVKNENDAGGLGGDANGIYEVTVVGTSLTMNRATDFDTDAEVFDCMQTYAMRGTINGETGWLLTTNNPITVGTGAGSSLIFVQHTNISTNNTENTWLGVGAGRSYSTGTSNTGIGARAGFAISTGSSNTATGYYSLSTVSTGTNNTAMGFEAARVFPAAGSNSTFYGYRAGYRVTGNIDVCYIGTQAGANIVNTATGTMAIGNFAMGGNTAATATGINNIAIGLNSMGLFNGGGSQNTGIGIRTLEDTTSGSNNTAVGFVAMEQITTGGANVAVGPGAVQSNTTGSSNIGIGYQALALGTAIANNVGIGFQALVNTTATSNVAIGTSAGLTNTSGDSNAAMGYEALRSNSTGSFNSCVGYQSLLNSTASNNSALGYQAGARITSGASNISIGYQSMFGGAGSCTGSDNVSVGRISGIAITTGSNNVLLGASSGTAITTGNHNVSLGAESLSTLTTGTHNIALGFQASQGGTITGSENISMGRVALQALTTGTQNICIGIAAGQNVSTSSSNTCIGLLSGSINNNGGTTGIGAQAARYSTGVGIVALGYLAGLSISSSPFTTAIGYQALRGADNTLAGGSNTAVGYQSMYGATGVAESNTCVGMESGVNISSNIQNTAIGMRAYGSSSAIASGNNNTALGYQALFACTTGGTNTCIGAGAGDSITTASNTTIVGAGSGTAIIGGVNNVIVGQGAGNALTSGNNNTFIGTDSDINTATVVGCVVIGSSITATSAGNRTFYMTGSTNGGGGALGSVSGTNLQYISTTGQIGPAVSSLKFKTNIHDIENELQSNNIYNLKPKSYNLIADSQNRLLIGYIAEDMNEYFPQIVPKDEQNEPYSINYDMLCVPIIMEMKKLRNRIQELEARLG